MQVVTGPSSWFRYTETQYKELDGGKTHRGFQLSMIFNYPTTVGQGEEVTVSISAPTGVILNVEEPFIDLATFFSNIGGYITICGLFGFLFGSGKISPFGFVTEYCFTTKDKESLMKNLVNDGNSSRDSEKVNAEAESKAPLTEYYVDMELFSK